jgi:tRNA(Ile)-lysidine synthase
MIQKYCSRTLNLISCALKDKTPDRPKLIIGLSGGPDSIFLTLILHELFIQDKIDLIAAHLDHQWRKESYKDVELCAQVCKKLGIKFVFSHAGELGYTPKLSGSLEEKGRRLRRFFLEKIKKEHNGHLIALAHHRQDQQETFFIRLIRGATLAGLCSIREIEGNYIHPLLFINKQEILNYLDAHKIPYVFDQTNTCEKFLRNRIRKFLLPALLQCDTRIEQKFDSTLKHLQQEEKFLQELTLEMFENIFSYTQEKLIGNTKKFNTIDPVLQNRVVIHWLVTQGVSFSLSSKYLEEIIKFITSPRGGTHKVGCNWGIYKKNKFFKIIFFI